MPEHIKSTQILRGDYLYGGRLVKKALSLSGAQLDLGYEDGMITLCMNGGPKVAFDPLTAKRLAVAILAQLGYHMEKVDAELTKGLS
jgi:hypothetical protein